MNTSKTQLYKILGIAVLLLQNFTIGLGSDLSTVLEVIADEARIKVSGRFTDGSSVVNRLNLGFVGEAGVGSRIEGMRVFDDKRTEVSLKTLAPGEYLAERSFQGWEYYVSLNATRSNKLSAHTSWIEGERGTLMLDDLLPQFGVGGRAVGSSVRLILPSGWQAYSSESSDNFQESIFTDTQKAVIVIGSGLRHLKGQVGTTAIAMTIDGNWHFSDDEAMGMVREIIEKYSTELGNIDQKSISLGIFRHPASVPHGSWEAETRGNTVTLVSSDMPFRTQSIQRLHEQLRHEIFHLWIPNGIKLKGNYAWFYEGFALYSSLKLGVMTKRIRFIDMLDTLSRAYAIDMRQKPRTPLIAIRPGSANTQTYARGLLFAFMLDVSLMTDTNGKNDAFSFLRDLIQKNKDAEPPEDANTELFKAIGRKGLIEKYVEGVAEPDLRPFLRNAGLEFDVTQRNPSIVIMKKPDRKQKALLDRLSYNTWRSFDRLDRK